jgi:uncharacterized cupredoxin-like copper-binding protein
VRPRPAIALRGGPQGVDSRPVAVYYVIGIALVVWAIVLTTVGVTREGFPPSRSTGRRLMAVSALLVAATVVAVIVTSEREHPREHAEAEAAAEKAEAKAGAGEASAPAGGGEAPGKTAEVVEAEYSVKLSAGNTLAPGKQTFEVANDGKIPHDLAVEGPGGEKKTPLIDPSKRARLEVALKPGDYKLYCTVPGHEQLGMKTEVTVR